MSNQRDSQNDRENIITIINSCEKILSYTDGMDWDNFIEDSCVVEACALNCVVLGERAHKLTREFKQRYPGVPWIEMENFRHRIAHTYGTLTYDISILWQTISSDIPDTLNYCRYVLKDYDESNADSTLRSFNFKHIIGKNR